MKIAYLGAGTWGFALAWVLAQNGHEVTVWTRSEEFAKHLQTSRMHPKLEGAPIDANVRFTSDLSKALSGAQVIVESVTCSGFREVFKAVGKIDIPVVITSKGIEQGTGFLLPEVLADIQNVSKYSRVAALSGPSHAEEVLLNKPTAIVSSAYEPSMAELVKTLFTTSSLRIYPNPDLHGVCFGGAVKNIIAIACGISDGLSDSVNAKAALMTRGLHEMRKLSVVKNANPETLNGLSGLGDLCVTCMSTLSRNYRFGRLLATGLSPKDAQNQVGAAVEGIYTCKSVFELGQKFQIPIPVTTATHEIIFGGLNPKEALKLLLTRLVKEEHL